MVRPDDDKVPRIRVVRVGVSNLWVLTHVLSFISQIAVLKLLYLYKAPLFLIKKVSIIFLPSYLFKYLYFMYFKKVCL